MSVDATALAVEPSIERFRSPGTVIARFVGRSVSKTATIMGYLYAYYVAASIWGFQRTYNTAAARQTLARLFGSNAGLQALFGMAHDIDTVRGFTAWRTLAVLTILGAVWALMAATKRFRGEEEAGRWELFLSGQTTGGLAAANTLAGLGAGLLIVYSLTAVAAIIVGNLYKLHFTASETLFYSLAVVASIAMFFAVGAFTSQIAATRRRAAGIAGAVFGVSFLMRAIGDATPSVHWLTYVSPLGWIEHLHPLTGSEPIWLLPIFGFVAVLCGLTLYFAGSRDLGASLIPDKDSARPRTRFLNTPLGLAVRETRASILGWLFAMAAGGMVMGSVAKAAGESIQASTSTHSFLKNLTNSSVTGAATYLGIVFLTFMTVLTVLAASSVNSIREDEAEGYLENLVTRPVSRLRWLGGRLLIAVLSIVIIGTVTGLFGWFGTASQHTGIALGRMIEAGINSAVPALLIVGIGLLTLGVKPRWTSGVMYGVIGWSFLLELIGPAINLNHWLLDTSILHHTALVPAVDPRWSSAGILIAIAAVAALLGAAAFNRRDLAGQ
jgi:polyether ionophore transport system permease protein